MKGFCPLASGSKGNCLYVGTENTRVLIDAGLTMRQTKERLSQIGVDLQTIQAIVVTHEHTDHIKGLQILSEKLNVPVLANAETAKGIYAAFGIRMKFKIFTTGEPFQFGDLAFHPFSVPHDTLDPVAFAIRTGSIKLGVCADLGHATSLVRKSLEECDYLYLEANHQPSMVHASPRPQVYKKRVLGKQGHLSNEECAALLCSVLNPKLKHVHLAHLSSECNSEEAALDIVGRALRSHCERLGQSIAISVAFQDKISKSILF